MTTFLIAVIVVVVLSTCILGEVWGYILALIAICVIVVGVWWVTPKQDEPKEQPTNVECIFSADW